MRFFFTGCIAVVLVLSLHVMPTSALELSPTIIERAGDPGSKISSALRVTNDEGAERTYYFSIQKFVPNGENGQQDFLPLSDTSGLPSWLFIERSSVTVKAGETQTIPFEIRIPSSTRPGGHYAAIFLSTLPPNQISSSSTQVVARTGALVILRVNGSLSESYAIDRLALNGASFTHPPVAFSMLVRNTGDIHLVPQGTMTIRNMFGRVSATILVNPQGSRVLPASNRLLSFAWEKQQDVTSGGFWHEAKAEWSNFAFGTYRATVQMDGPVSGPNTATITFAIWPWHLAIAALLFLMCLLILARIYRSWVIRVATAPKS